MKTVNDKRALKMVRQFHNNRIARFLLGKEDKNLEGLNDLKRSQAIVREITEKING